MMKKVAKPEVHTWGQLPYSGYFISLVNTPDLDDEQEHAQTLSFSFLWLYSDLSGLKNNKYGISDPYHQLQLFEEYTQIDIESPGSPNRGLKKCR